MNRLNPDPEPSGAGLPFGLASLIAVLFLLLAFSTDIIEAITATISPGWESDVPRLPRIVTLPIDVLLIVGAILLGRRARSEAGVEGKAVWRWIVVGIVVTLAADVVFIVAFGHSVSVVADALLSLVYLPALYLLWCGIVGVTPRIFRLRRGASPLEPLARRSAAAVVPLVIGVGAAYIGETLYWRELLADGSRIDQEYFAQISQVLPLLAIALGFESRFTDRGRKLIPAELGVGVFTVMLLVIAEALAISALPVDNDEVLLYTWHEYVAFTVTLYACFVALAMLVAVLVISLHPGGTRATQ